MTISRFERIQKDLKQGTGWADPEADIAWLVRALIGLRRVAAKVQTKEANDALYVLRAPDVVDDEW